MIGRMASATLRRPISCSSVALATRPSLVLGTSGENDVSARDVGQWRDRGRDWPNQLSDRWTLRGPTPVGPATLLAAPGLRVQPLQTGAMASAPVRRPGHGGRPVACSTRSAQPFLITPAAGNFVPPARWRRTVRRRTGFSNPPAAPPRSIPGATGPGLLRLVPEGGAW